MPKVKSAMVFQTKIKIIKNSEVAPKYFKMAFAAPLIAKHCKPGQFIEIKVSDGSGPLLRRPFGIHTIGYRFSGSGNRQHARKRMPSTIEVLYEIRGAGTELLSRKKSGEFLDIIGPLGNGFNLTPHAGGRTTILVAGGMGVAPLTFLAEKIAAIKPQKPRIKNLVLIGAKTKSHILCREEFKKIGFDVTIATDDGSIGYKGYVTKLLENVLRTTHAPRLTTAIYGCGPQPMLWEVSRIARGHRIPAQVSLEAHMACGIGACLGCVVDTVDGFKRVCKDGPVFEAGKIVWEKE
jgi:dihydroorotate dehydrogenase electron transfer subunit